jgi:isopentenyl-diphosphate Delta-isomerase
VTENKTNNKKINPDLYNMMDKHNPVVKKHIIEDSNYRNQLVLVDRQDSVLGTKDKMIVHQLGELHRAFSVFIFRKSANQSLELLLQKRHINKYHSGGLWSNSCCGHPLLYEDCKASATRRVTEELGITLELSKVDSFIYKEQVATGLIEHELDHVFIGFYQQKNYFLQPHPLEVDDLQWKDITTFDEWLASNVSKNITTVWLGRAWSLVKKHLIK